MATRPLPHFCQSPGKRWHTERITAPPHPASLSLPFRFPLPKQTWVLAGGRGAASRSSCLQILRSDTSLPAWGSGVSLRATERGSPTALVPQKKKNSEKPRPHYTNPPPPEHWQPHKQADSITNAPKNRMVLKIASYSCMSRCIPNWQLYTYTGL